MQSRYIVTEAVVIKRFNYADADRFVTLFTQAEGKISGLARGVRKIQSRKRVALEPLNRVKVSLVNGTKGFIITEAHLLDSYQQSKASLYTLTQAMQFIELIDGLTGEEEAHPEVYLYLTHFLQRHDAQGVNKIEILEYLKQVLDKLGFSYPFDSEVGLKRHIEELLQRNIRSKDFLLGTHKTISFTSG